MFANDSVLLIIRNAEILTFDSSEGQAVPYDWSRNDYYVNHVDYELCFIADHAYVCLDAECNCLCLIFDEQ
jgi:hypothetical protein